MRGACGGRGEGFAAHTDGRGCSSTTSLYGSGLLIESASGTAAAFSAFISACRGTSRQADVVPMSCHLSRAT